MFCKVPFPHTDCDNRPCPVFSWMAMGISSCPGTAPRDIGHGLVRGPVQTLCWRGCSPSQGQSPSSDTHLKPALPSAGFLQLTVSREQPHRPAEAPLGFYVPTSLWESSVPGPILSLQGWPPTRACVWFSPTSLCPFL